MSNIKIHGQKMQFHKKVAISVTLASGTGGTATFEPVPSVDYTLSSLPIGVQIVKSNGDYLMKHNNVTIGEVEASPASGYAFTDMVLWKNSGAIITISTTPITLDDSDVIVASFVSTMKEIQFYLGWEYQGYGDPWNYAKLYYNGQPLNPNVSYIEMQDNRDKVQLDITDKGLGGSFKFYVNGGSSSDGLIAEISDPTYKISQIQYYDADAGTTYTCDGTSTIIGNVGDMGMARILLDIGQTCALVSYSEAQIQAPAEISGRVQQALYQSYPLLQFQQWRQPMTFNYIFYDGANRYGIGVATCGYPGQNPGEIRNGEVIIPFFYDGYTTYSTPFDMNGFAMGQLPYWQDTGYYLSTSLLDTVFYMGDTSGLTQREAQWSASNVCDLGTIIYTLATNK